MGNELLKIISEKERPVLVADFVLREDWLFLELANYSLKPALNVKIQFSQSIPGLAERKDFNQLNIFSKLKYIAPLKEFEIPVNRINTALSALRKKEIEIQLTYEDERKQRYEQRILHDLSIYEDFPIIIKNTKYE
ncbi:MAG: hypothetical protein ACK4TA_19445 [Saprospiraceae bacterium]